jgi:hypothetical protein
MGTAFLSHYFIFKVLIKVLIAIYLKRSSFWICVDVKPVSNDLMLPVHWQYVFALSLLDQANLIEAHFGCRLQ